MIELSPQIIEEAKAIIKDSIDGRVTLPRKLVCASLFYVALPIDNSVIAFGSIRCEDVTFKIGPLRSQA
jgi:hypothetical protein